MRRFQLVIALIVALATSVGLRAAARHQRWPIRSGMPGGRCGYGPDAGSYRGGYGRFGGWGRPLPPTPAAPVGPAPVAPAMPQ